MGMNLLNAIILAVVVIVVIMINQYRLLHNRRAARTASIEKKVTKYCAHEGYECKKEDGILNIKRTGANFRIFLNGKDDISSISLWIQYAIQLDKDLNKMHWFGQTVMVNLLNDRHPSLNVSIDTKDHVLWAHYRADIRTQKEFAFHFNGAYGEIQSLMKDYNEVLPKLLEDFTIQQKQQKPIGFS